MRNNNTVVSRELNKNVAPRELCLLSFVKMEDRDWYWYNAFYIRGVALRFNNLACNVYFVFILSPSRNNGEKEFE